MKHTPGPWDRNIKAGGKYPIIFAGRNQHVAQACQQKNPDETEANISLIAAAPDLLAALEALLDPATNEDGGWYTDARRAARAAIARARGEE